MSNSDTLHTQINVQEFFFFEKNLARTALLRAGRLLILGYIPWEDVSFLKVSPGQILGEITFCPFAPNL